METYFVAGMPFTGFLEWCVYKYYPHASEEAQLLFRYVCCVCTRITCCIEGGSGGDAIFSLSSTRRINRVLHLLKKLLLERLASDP
jgi:hypothetical protein